MIIIIIKSIFLLFNKSNFFFLNNQYNFNKMNQKQ